MLEDPSWSKLQSETYLVDPITTVLSSSTYSRHPTLANLIQDKFLQQQLPLPFSRTKSLARFSPFEWGWQLDGDEADISLPTPTQ